MHDEGKPGFGATARSVGEVEVDEMPIRVKLKARLKEVRQQRAVEEGLKGEPEDWARVR